ncbi:MAG: hypothetical protein A2854_02505 [Parcubacteria group bacterium RIFCSPHIGHO2_01_FULL_56_18]|nr:MAG: hypothetical protein A2854_02505 [Parcubacteria group bacterium RIFCSPHIGHO2_01_FULL_56_18]
MYDYHVLLGILAIIAGLVGEVLYIKDIVRGTIKPHPFSWFGWGILDVIILSAQTVRGGGAGAWVMGVAAVVNIGIAIASLRRGEKRITQSDWICFIGALLGIGLWIVTDDPFWAVIVAAVVNCVAFIPTFRKSFVRPFEESLTIFVFDIIKFGLSIVALQALNPTTALFPAVSAISNIVFVAMVLFRRRQLAKRGRGDTPRQ